MSTPSPDSTTNGDVAPQGAPRCWLYLLLLGVESLGCAFFYWKALPLYRQAVDSTSGYTPSPDTPHWAVLAFALILGGYWTCFIVRPTLPRLVSPILGHGVSFLSRLVFTLPTSIFSMVFITKRLPEVLSTGRYALTILGLFAVYCYMEELNRLGRILLGSNK